jgi:iron complex outermembrane receptor protein
MKSLQAVSVVLMLCAADVSGISSAQTDALAQADKPVQTDAWPGVTELNVDDVVVTATRFEEPAGQTVIGTEVVSGEQIRASGVRTVTEYLSQLPGIYTRDNFGSPNQQIDMRGFGANSDQNVLVLVDGQRISENEQVPADLASIPLDSVERVEIVRGSGSVLYGSGASGGTINIITRGGGREMRSGSISAGIGTYDTEELAASAVVGGKRGAMSLYANYYDSDNYRDNNNLTQQNVQSDFRIFSDYGPVYIKIGGGDQDLRLPGSRTEQQLETDRRGTDTPNDYGTLQTGRVNLGTHLESNGIETAIDLTYRTRDSFAVNQPGSIDIEGSDTAFSPRIKVPFVYGATSHELVIGLDWNDWDYQTSALFPPFAPSAFSSTQTNSGVFFKDSMFLQSGTSVSFGARTQRVKTTITDLTGFSPEQVQTRNLEAWELALRQALSPELSVYVRSGKSFRVANVDDNRFLAQPLEPQTSEDIELGTDYRSSDVAFRAALYRMNLDNEIAFMPSDVLPPFGGNVNLPPTERNGVELEARWNARHWLILSGQYTYAEARYREGDLGGVDITGNNIPLVPRHRAGMTLSVLPAPAVLLTATVAYVGEQYYDNDQTNSFGRLMPSYTLTDLTASYRMRRWTFTGVINNLFNELYYSYAIASTTSPIFNAYPAAERSLLVKAQYRF